MVLLMCAADEHIPLCQLSDVSLAKGREVSVLRLDRGKSEVPLGLSLVAADLTELRDPDAALFVSSTYVKQVQ